MRATCDAIARVCCASKSCARVRCRARAAPRGAQALSLRPDDTFTKEMLARALEDVLLPEAEELAKIDALPGGASGAGEDVADMEMAA